MWPNSANSAKNSFGTARPAKRVFSVDTKWKPAQHAGLISIVAITLFLVTTIVAIMVAQRLAAVSTDVDVA